MALNPANLLIFGPDLVCGPGQPLDSTPLIQILRDRRQDLLQSRNALVQDYTARMQAATLSATVIRLSLRLSAKTFKLDQEMQDLDFILEGLETSGN